MIKKIFFIFVLTAAVLQAKLSVILSIAPEEYFAKAISGYLNSEIMVEPGNSPHTYEPRPSQMKMIEKADLYLAIGVEFESIWLEKFSAQNPKMKIVDISRGIKRIPMTSNRDNSSRRTERMDPHIWTSPSNVRIIAANIANALSEANPEEKEKYSENLDRFLRVIDELDTKIKEKLSKIPRGSSFMVFHPAWGYFAREYGLKQIAVEIEGKEPKPKQLAKLIEKAKREKARMIVVQPEFSDKSAKLIAKELNIPVVKISPLNADWYNTELKLAECIAGNCKGL